MNKLWVTFQERQDEFFKALLEHIQISLVALLIAIIIAIPLGIFLTRRKGIAEGVIGTSAVMQTIPSLALLGLLIPLVGIGKVNATIALVAYALLPILRNTYTGINEINPILIEAGKGMGMNHRKLLFKVELPLAMPVIMAGIRTGMVLIVATTTLAGLVGAGGLGDIILLGIDRNDTMLIVLGAIPAALLTLLIDGGLRLIERIIPRVSFKMTAIVSLAIALVIAIPIVWNAWGGKEADLVVAGKLGAEPEIIINMYKLMIEQDTDLNVETKPGLGKTTFVFKALQSGDIDIYPEFTGTAISTFLKEDPVSMDPDEVYEQAKSGMAKKYDMTMLKAMGYNNGYGLAVTKDAAERYGLTEISDLKSVQDEMKAGFTLEFSDREDGYLGIQQKYGLEFPQLKTMEPSLRYKATESGTINLVDAYTTDSELSQYDLQVLEDDQGLFPPYQGAPLLRDETLEKHPELKDILNKLAGKITDEEMSEMNFQVDVNDASPEKIARDYLEEEGLLDDE